MGSTLGLPLLPLFLEHRGGTPSVIGIIMASFFVAGVVTQYSSGISRQIRTSTGAHRQSHCLRLRVDDLLTAVAAPWFILTRVVQGASAGAIEVASMSAVAALFAEEKRGGAISRIFAAQLFGMALGPVVGVVASVHDLGGPSSPPGSSAWPQRSWPFAPTWVTPPRP